MVAGKQRGSSGSPHKEGTPPAAVPVVGEQRAGVARGRSGEARTDAAHALVFSREAACQLPTMYFELLVVGISLDYFRYSIPNCSKGITSELSSKADLKNPSHGA